MRWGRIAFIAIPLLALAALLVFASQRGEDAGVSIPLSPSAAGVEGPLPAITPARGENPPLVVIDAGHGGRDPGARSALGGEQESRVTLALALAMRDALAATGRVRVALSRSDDTYIALEDRYAIARRLGADLFVSVHADIAPANDQARGATIYTLSEVASDREAAALAERENEANRLGPARMNADPNVNLILIDLAQRESMDRAAEFARLLHREAAPTIPVPPRLAPLRRLHRAESARHSLDPVRGRLSFQPSGRRRPPVRAGPAAHRRGHAPRDRGAFRAPLPESRRLTGPHIPKALVSTS